MIRSIVALACVLVIWAGEGLAQKTDKLVQLDLSKAGAVQGDNDKKAPWQLVIQAPEGAKAEVWVLSGIMVKKGNNFLLEIAGYHHDLADYKDKWKADKQTKAIVMDTEEAIMREVISPIDEKKVGFQMMMNLKVGDKKFSCRSLPNTYQFTKADAELMLKCARTLKAK